MSKSLLNALWWIVIVLALLIGFYPFVMYALGRPFAILSLKSSEVLNYQPWQIFFHTHIVFGGIALLIGWVQFIIQIRIKHPYFHIQLGKIYVLAVIISATSGICSSFYANGSTWAFSGLFLLGCLWLIITTFAFYQAAHKNIRSHQILMIFSYAATFSGVTLRIWLPLLILFSQDFNLAYDIACWVSWVPNLIIAGCIVKYKKNDLYQGS